MLFLALIITVALVFFIRFFIIRSLRTEALRRQTLSAAVRAIYFIPVFSQAVLLLWIAVFHFHSICTGIFSLLDDLVSLRRPTETGLLLLPCYIAVGALLLCCNFILAKISMNKKADPLNILYKFIYLVFSACMLWITKMNGPLMYPLIDPEKQMFFYNQDIVIVFGLLAYATILLLHFFYKKQNKILVYSQLMLRIIFIYFFIVFLLASLVLLLYRLMKLVA